MKPVRAIIMEEHHEAFFVWNLAVAQKWIEATKNALLHADSHADFSIPSLSTSLKELGGETARIYDFTYNELSIESFILPTVYQGMFRELYWLRLEHFLKQDQKTIHVFSQRGEGRSLLMTENIHIAGVFNPERKHAYANAITAEEPLVTSLPIVLDIDLDYFSCDDATGGSWEVECTAETFEAFRKDRYHPLRLKFGGKMRAEKRDGKFFLCFTPPSVSRSKQQEKPEIKILEHIAAFVDFLRKNRIQPQIIDICRSRYSGFTPADQWQFIEEKLLKGLGKLYKLEIINIHDLVGQLNPE